MKRFSVSFPSGHSHEVWIGVGILERIAGFIRSTNSSQVFLVSDKRVKQRASEIHVALKARGIPVVFKTLTVTEDLKNFHQLEPLFSQLVRNHVDRSSVLIAVGGGVIGDTLGFLAATYLRGIRWVGVPTTLLAQVDSALGGKTGVNHALGKNLIGAIHQPALVVCDGAFLMSLLSRDQLSGFAEMLKVALVFDPPLALQLRTAWEKKQFLKGCAGEKQAQGKLMGWIQACLKWKAWVVTQDERETQGLRAQLNFGHTFAHALEAQTGYQKFRHGEAVAHGMRLALHLSVLRGHLNEAQAQPWLEFLQSLPLPALPKSVPFSSYWDLMQRDKKTQAQRIKWVLLRGIGQCVMDSQVQKREVHEAWRLLMAQSTSSPFPKKARFKRSST
ncbi:MAG: 3-dehydroquinate synthase [Bdellovibrionia bacterium]